MTLVIGSSGFLGRRVVPAIKARTSVLCTHHQRQIFSNSYPFNVFTDDIRPLLEKAYVTTVVFTAMVEMEASNKVRPAMKQFISACRDCRVVYLSSDGIFDGKRGNYTEGDTPTPCTQYGENLVFCETVIRDVCADYGIIRPSYIYGFSAGQLDPRLSRMRTRLERAEKIDVFDDMYKSPLGVCQVAEAVATITLSGYVGTLHVAGTRMSVSDFVQQAMKALGVDTSGLFRCSTPTKPGFLRDTSLNSSLWQTIFSTRPLSIQETLSVHKQETFS